MRSSDIKRVLEDMDDETRAGEGNSTVQPADLLRREGDPGRIYYPITASVLSMSRICPEERIVETERTKEE